MIIARLLPDTNLPGLCTCLSLSLKRFYHESVAFLDVTAVVFFRDRFTVAPDHHGLPFARLALLVRAGARRDERAYPGPASDPARLSAARARSRR